MATIQVRIEDDLKKKADALFKELGTDTTSAVRMFLTQAIAYEGIPFEIRKYNRNSLPALTEDEIIEKLALSCLEAKKGNYRDADTVLKDIHKKYGI